jgi:MazG family protein
VALAELDRTAIPWDHLTHLSLEPVPTEVPTGSAHGVRAIVARLRAPQIGCPWDLEQTPESLTRYVIEEAYEVIEAIREGTAADVTDELGDLLLQVALQAEIADQDGSFDWNDVMWALSSKLIRRHPHVFGEATAANAAEVVRNWDLLKAAERQDQPKPASVLDTVGKHLPALKQAAELCRRAAQAGFDWPERTGALAKVAEELGELLRADTLAERREELGDVLYSLAKLAQDDGLDPEEALRAANAKFQARFQLLEAIARDRGWESLHDRPLDELLAAWQEAKQRVHVQAVLQSGEGTT